MNNNSNSNSTLQKSDKKDRVLIGISSVGLIFCLGLLFSNSFYSFFFQVVSKKSKGAIIGEILFTQNDIRYKSSDSFSWDKAKKEQNIRSGDSIFSGDKSKSQVKMKTGGSVDLDQNSLVKFTTIDNIELPNLALGNFKVTVDGTMKIAIGGEITEIQGNGSEVQIILKEKEKPKIFLLKGKTKIKAKTLSALPVPVAEQNLRSKSTALPLVSNQSPIIDQKIRTYTDELYDIFELKEKKLIRKTNPNVFDGKKWSSSGLLLGPSKPLDIEAPRVALNSNKFILKDNVEITGKIQSELNNFALEIASTRDFKSDETRVLWLTSNDFKFRLTKPENLFIRVRGVDNKLRLTKISSLSEIEIRNLEPPTHKPAETPPPKISKILKEKKSLPTKESNKISNSMAFKKETRLEGSKKIETLRRPTNLVSSKTKILKTTEPLKKDTDSKVSIEGAAFTLYSVDQAQQGKLNPTAMTMGIHWLSWSGSQGFEGSIKSKLADSSFSPGQSANPLQIEGRYRYRIKSYFNPFSKNHLSEISFIGAYEYYKNSGNTIFSPGYSLLKGGVGLIFPFLYKWNTGGEILVGRGMDSSEKYEMSGNLNYYLDPRWSLGIGYRVHLFQAGSTTTASQLGLPYREGFGEGYSVFQWHY